MALPAEPVLVPSSIVEIQSRVYNNHLTKSHPVSCSLSYATGDWCVAKPRAPPTRKVAQTLINTPGNKKRIVNLNNVERRKGVRQVVMRGHERPQKGRIVPIAEWE